MSQVLNFGLILSSWSRWVCVAPADGYLGCFSPVLSNGSGGSNTSPWGLRCTYSNVLTCLFLPKTVSWSEEKCNYFHVLQWKAAETLLYRGLVSGAQQEALVSRRWGLGTLPLPEDQTKLPRRKSYDQGDTTTQGASLQSRLDSWHSQHLHERTHLSYPSHRSLSSSKIHHLLLRVPGHRSLAPQYPISSPFS